MAENTKYGLTEIRQDGAGGDDRAVLQASMPRTTEVTSGGVWLRTLLAVDIVGFGDRKRGDGVRHHIRQSMYRLLAKAVADSGVVWADCYHEDRGDGILLIPPPETQSGLLIHPLVDHLRAGLRWYNKLAGDAAEIRMRMCVHAGHVRFDAHGVGGRVVLELFRMLDATAFKRAFSASEADFGLLVADDLYEDVISDGFSEIDPAMYAPLSIRNKEFRARAWLYLPPIPNPFLVSGTWQLHSGTYLRDVTAGLTPSSGSSRVAPNSA